MKIKKYSIILVMFSIWGVSCSKGDSTISNNNTTTPIKTDSSTIQAVNYADSSFSDLMAYSSGSTYSAKTPMGVHFEGLHTTTAADTIWLNDPSNQPSIPASTSGLHWSTFAVNLFSYASPDPVEVNQHAIGDCDGLAAMACMAYEAPDFIKHLIVDNGNNTYTVSMFDPTGKAIKVSVSSKFLAGSSGEIEACSSQGSNTATWATILEKAIMKYNDIYKFIADIGGIGSEYATPLFTGIGNSFAFSPGSLTPMHLEKVVKIALAKGQFVTGGFTKENVLIGSDYTVTGHAYTVLLSMDSTALFSMRNPWGFSPSPTGTIQDNGVLNIPSIGSIVSLVDVRIIDPGLAGTKGTTQAYQKPKM